jgi:hypothetical protein
MHRSTHINAYEREQDQPPPVGRAQSEVEVWKSSESEAVRRPAIGWIAWLVVSVAARESIATI